MKTDRGNPARTFHKSSATIPACRDRPPFCGKALICSPGEPGPRYEVCEISGLGVLTKYRSLPRSRSRSRNFARTIIPVSGNKGARSLLFRSRRAGRSGRWTFDRRRCQVSAVVFISTLGPAERIRVNLIFAADSASRTYVVSCDAG